jgi:deoxyribodipyrimidine photo-lyase
MPSSTEIALVWFRRDLRLDDNPAWAAATSTHQAVVPLFVLDPRLLDAAGPYRRRQLIANLQALDYDLFERRGGRLHVRVGDPVVIVPEVATRYRANSVHWNADVTPFATERDRRVSAALELPVMRHHGTLVHPPGAVRTAKGTLSRVFTPFYNAWRKTAREPWPEPGDAVLLDHPGDPLPTLDAPALFPEGEAEAARRLEAFVDRVDAYASDHDRLAVEGTSSLSTDLKFGTLSPRTVVDAIGEATPGRTAFVRQIAWRDWYAHLLADMPTLVTKAMRERYDDVEWRNDPGEISAWKGGYTGYPVIDAGMRQLRQTGWMHNRARLLCGSFLVKNLLVDWRIGERHFRHLLVDGDVAQNVGNWQWVAGTGPDAASYNRIFNPVTQSRKFDPDGDYIRRWIPELAGLDASHIHAPWEAASDGLFAGPTGDYPPPIVDLRESRARALAAYAAVDDKAVGMGSGSK